MKKYKLYCIIFDVSSLYLYYKSHISINCISFFSGPEAVITSTISTIAISIATMGQAMFLWTTGLAPMPQVCAKCVLEFSLK